MFYYHMTSKNNITSIAKQGLIAFNGKNGKLVGKEKKKVFFSEGFEGAIALYVDFNVVYEKIKKGQEIIDKHVEKQVLNSNSLHDFLGEGVYLRFNGSNIYNERNFENGCTDKTIPPEDINICYLKKIGSNVKEFSRFEIIKFMMSKVKPEQIKYYGTIYDGSPEFEEATKRIQNKVKLFYEDNMAEISKYFDEAYRFETIPLLDFINEMAQDEKF